MKKRLLLLLATAFGVSSGMFAADYNDGDYIETMNGGFVVSGSNLITNGLGAFTTCAGTPVLENDTFTVSNDGPDGSQCITVSKGGSATMSSETSKLNLTPTLFYNMPLTANQRYVVTYKVKGYLESNSASIIMVDGRVTQFQDIYLNREGGVGRDAASDSYVSIAKHITYGDSWTEFSYDFVVPDTAQYVNILFAQLLGNDQFCDFGIYSVTKVADQRNIQDVVDRLSFYKDTELFPENQDVLESILETYQPMIGDYEGADDNTISDDLKDLDEEFLDANSEDVSGYYTNFGFEKNTISTKGGAASGWTSSIGKDRFGVSAATGNFTSNHVTQDIGANYNLNAASYYQTVSLPAGKYLYGVQVQWYRYLYKGGSSSWNANYYEKNPGIKFYINNDTVSIDSVPSYRGRFVQHVFEVKEDGDVTIGFYTPGTTDSYGGHLMFDNILLRRIGTGSVEEYYYKEKVADAMYALKVMIDSAKVVVASDKYIYGRQALQDSIDVADTRYAAEYTMSQETVDLLTTYMTWIRQGIRDYYTINKEYTTLGEAIDEATTLLNGEEGAKRPTGKDEFQSVVDGASAYYNSLSVGSDRDSTQLADYAAAIEAAKTKWYMANASVNAPAEAGLVNGSFKDSSKGWTLTGSNTGKSKYGSNSLFDDGYCYYYNRGYTATDYFNLYQDVAITETGVYKFTAQCMANNESWDMSGDDWSGFNTYTYLYSDTDSTYVITKGVNTKNSYNPGTDVQWFTSTSKVSDLSTLSAGSGVLRVGVELRQGNTVNMVYVGSAHLYYYGSISDYETGIVTVKDITNQTLNGAVYNLSGLKVGNSLNGLSKGIYIMNGKKYVVK